MQPRYGFECGEELPDTMVFVHVEQDCCCDFWSVEGCHGKPSLSLKGPVDNTSLEAKSYFCELELGG
jgi:hypothetical protein